nr:calmodulin, CaM {C-terminal T12 peptide} [Hordeum vulgare=barley, Peptide Partial, 13 aa] [Hordeum vulgare]
ADQLTDEQIAEFK